MDASTSSSQETRLREIVHLAGLSPTAVQFRRAEDWETVWNSVYSSSGRDRAPLIIELGSNLRGPWQGVDRFHSNIFARDIFFFGSAASARTENTEIFRAPEAPKTIDDHISAHSEVCFSDDPSWGSLRSLRARWKVPSDQSPGRLGELPGLWHPLISFGGKPWFLRCDGDRAAWFLWAVPHLPDISKPISPAEEEQGTCLLSVLPLFIFLRHAFREKVWHAPAPLANMVIDDPPIRDRYGFFSPARLLASLADVPQATTVAFIPWNWNRSTEAAAALFRTHPSQLSLCVHGCDHTGGEFASLDQATLRAKCRLALRRIELFRQRTELSCEPVMVFPQGLFSRAAIAALRETNFIAAVNSTLFPVDSETIVLADLIKPAFTGIEDFPIFLRRYPRDPALCAIDLFLGRPLIVVEHHEYFRHGYEDYRRFLEAINRFANPPKWLPLDRLVQRACLQRELEPGMFEVQFYGNSFILDNPSSEKLSYRLVRPWSQPQLIRGLLVNGNLVPSTFEDGKIRVLLDLPSQSSAKIQVLQKSIGPDNLFKGSLTYRTRVWLRRTLCDLRDNHVWLSSFARWTKRIAHSD